MKALGYARGLAFDDRFETCTNSRKTWTFSIGNSNGATNGME